MSGGVNYANSNGYVCLQAVSDKNIITASGSVSLEFAKKLLLENDTPQRIEMFYKFHEQGFYSEKQLLNAFVLRNKKLVNYVF